MTSCGILTEWSAAFGCGPVTACPDYGRPSVGVASSSSRFRPLKMTSCGILTGWSAAFGCGPVTACPDYGRRLVRRLGSAGTGPALASLRVRAASGHWRSPPAAFSPGRVRLLAVARSRRARTTGVGSVPPEPAQRWRGLTREPPPAVEDHLLRHFDRVECGVWLWPVHCVPVLRA